MRPLPASCQLRFSLVLTPARSFQAARDAARCALARPTRAPAAAQASGRLRSAAQHAWALPGAPAAASASLYASAAHRLSPAVRLGLASGAVRAMAQPHEPRAAIQPQLRTTAPLEPAELVELTLASDAAFTRALLAELMAASSGGEAPAEHPASKFPELSAPWMPSELVFEASHLSVFGLSSPPEDHTLGPAPDMPDRAAPALGRTPFERSLHPRVVAVLTERLKWAFDVIELGAACAAAGPDCPGPLVVLGCVLFEDAGLCAEFSISEPVLLAYFSAIQAGYLAQPYHNALHACDVLAAMNYVLTASGVDRCLSRVEMMAALVAAAVHDFAHPGVNNAFLVATSAPLARRYNDTHVLENYHLCSTFAIMARPECNLVAGMAPADVRALRRQVIALVLATDMSGHSAFMAEAARRLAVPGGLSLASNEADRDLALRLCLKCADISNAAKPVGYAVRWGVAILTELFRQGDLERRRGMAINPLCDRALVSVSSAQQGFLDGIARPLFAQLGALAPALSQGAVARIMRNSVFYASKAPKTAEGKS